MKAAILTIGTEITSGEIVNRNAADLAQKLESVNIETLMHISVPDEKNLILNALNSLEQIADLIIVTGGLGPTSDDFTRYVIADYAGVDLFFDKAVYKELEEKLQNRGRKIREGHKNQCYFPVGAKLLPNPAGHALPFQLNIKNKRLYVLPGPPREIESIWNLALQSELQKLNIKKESYLFKWKCFGKGESEFAEIVEAIFADSGFKIGYRATVPNVIIKVWVPETKMHLKEKYFSEFENQMKNFIVSNDTQ